MFVNLAYYCHGIFTFFLLTVCNYLMLSAHMLPDTTFTFPRSDNVNICYFYKLCIFS